MNACCRAAVVDRYLSVWGEPVEGAALFCPACRCRVEYYEGEWRTV